MSDVSIPPARRWASIPTAATYIGVDPWTIRRWVRTGRLTAYRFSQRTIRVDLAEVDALGGA